MVTAIVVLAVATIGGVAAVKLSDQSDTDGESERGGRTGIVPRYKRTSSADMGPTAGWFMSAGSDDGGYGGHHHGGGFDGGSCGGSDGGSGGGDSGGGC